MCRSSKVTQDVWSCGIIRSSRADTSRYDNQKFISSSYFCSRSTLKESQIRASSDPERVLRLPQTPFLTGRRSRHETLCCLSHLFRGPCYSMLAYLCAVASALMYQVVFFVIGMLGLCGLAVRKSEDLNGRGSSVSGIFSGHGGSDKDCNDECRSLQRRRQDGRPKEVSS